MAKEIGIFQLKHLDANGEVIWEDEVHNDMLDEGELDMLDVYLRGATGPSSFSLRLFNDVPVETDGVLDLTGEPSGNGYSAQTIERSAVGWPTLATDTTAVDGDYPAKASSKTVTFAASGGTIGPVSHICLVSSDVKLITGAALSQSRTLNDGESLQAQYFVKQL